MAHAASLFPSQAKRKKKEVDTIRSFCLQLQTARKMLLELDEPSKWL